MIKSKRVKKLKGRVTCHGNTTNCQKEHAFIGRPETKKTPVGTKPKLKDKKVYKK